jgi:hypothetical protein
VRGGPYLCGIEPHGWSDISVFSGQRFSSFIWIWCIHLALAKFYFFSLLSNGLLVQPWWDLFLVLKGFIVLWVTALKIMLRDKENMKLKMNLHRIWNLLL